MDIAIKTNSVSRIRNKLHRIIYNSDNDKSIRHMSRIQKRLCTRVNAHSTSSSSSSTKMFELVEICTHIRTDGDVILSVSGSQNRLSHQCRRYDFFSRGVGGRGYREKKRFEEILFFLLVGLFFLIDLNKKEKKKESTW